MTVPPLTPLVVFTPAEARALSAILQRLCPADEGGPGATEIGVLDYLDRALSGPYAELRDPYRLGLFAIDQASSNRFQTDFAQASADQQDALLAELEAGAVKEFSAVDPKQFFELVRAHLQEGLFSDPWYGGNRNKGGWRLLRHPGVWLENSAEENLCPEPVDKGGVIQSLADIELPKPKSSSIPNYDPQRGSADPRTDVDIVLVGAGSMGSIVAPIFAKAGLKVIAFEPGPFRTQADYLPDELGAAYYCRANMGPKFASEIPRWRRNEGEPTTAATFSLGRMMNSVGGSVIHYGAWLLLFHPPHFRNLSQDQKQAGDSVLSEGVRTQGWPGSFEGM